MQLPASMLGTSHLLSLQPSAPQAHVPTEDVQDKHDIGDQACAPSCKPAAASLPSSPPNMMSPADGEANITVRHLHQGAECPMGVAAGIASSCCAKSATAPSAMQAEDDSVTHVAAGQPAAQPMSSVAATAPLNALAAACEKASPAVAAAVVTAAAAHWCADEHGDPAHNRPLQQGAGKAAVAAVASEDAVVDLPQADTGQLAAYPVMLDTEPEMLKRASEQHRVPFQVIIHDVTADDKVLVIGSQLMAFRTVGDCLAHLFADGAQHEVEVWWEGRPQEEPAAAAAADIAANNMQGEGAHIEQPLDPASTGVAVDQQATSGCLVRAAQHAVTASSPTPADGVPKQQKESKAEKKTKRKSQQQKTQQHAPGQQPLQQQQDAVQKKSNKKKRLSLQQHATQEAVRQQQVQQQQQLPPSQDVPDHLQQPQQQQQQQGPTQPAPQCIRVQLDLRQAAASVDGLRQAVAHLDKTRALCAETLATELRKAAKLTWECPAVPYAAALPLFLDLQCLLQEHGCEGPVAQQQVEGSMSQQHLTKPAADVFMQLLCSWEPAGYVLDAVFLPTVPSLATMPDRRSWPTCCTSKCVRVQGVLSSHLLLPSMVGYVQNCVRQGQQPDLMDWSSTIPVIMADKVMTLQQLYAQQCEANGYPTAYAADPGAGAANVWVWWAGFTGRADTVQRHFMLTHSLMMPIESFLGYSGLESVFTLLTMRQLACVLSKHDDQHAQVPASRREAAGPAADAGTCTRNVRDQLRGTCPCAAACEDAQPDAKKVCRQPSTGAR